METINMPIKTFRGLLNDEAQERIRLETLDGKKGYRIKKFQIIPNKPGAESTEAVIKIFSILQTAVDATINFSEQTLLAAGFFRSNASAAFATDVVILFDNVTFNQDIFITSSDLENNKMNYYLELEQISLDDIEATAVILKNFRNTNTV